jgi:SAM-dependent methyltransferase
MSAFRNRWAYPNTDPALTLFDRAVRAWNLDLPPGARVLELGCCESDFSEWLLKADPTIQLTGVDVRPCEGYKGTFMQGAAESMPFAPSSFEAVILLGSLEHFGLGYYGDPKQSDADNVVMERIAEWLVPGGWCYYDVPWTPAEGYVSDNRHYRVYEDRSLPMADGLVPVRRAYATDEGVRPQWTRPTEPASPFWFIQRLLEKPS